MRKAKRYVSAGVGLLSAGLAVAGYGCVDLTSDCVDTAVCGAERPATPPECVPGQAKGSLSGACGVFVASASSGIDGDGSKDSPFTDVEMALEKAKTDGKPVYLCAGTFTKPVRIDHDAEIFGGLDCDNGWVPAGGDKKTVWTAPADEIPLRVATKVRVTLADIRVMAADAMAAGGSSIALIAEQGAEIDLVRCDVEAGEGKDGADGAAFDAAAWTAGANGQKGLDACQSRPDTFVAPTSNTCPAGEVSSGGAGGDGEASAGLAGSDGAPGGSPNGGSGEFGSHSCEPGAAGGSGEAGGGGLGGSGKGSLSSQGFSGAAGNDGGAGKVGQGGGGGGGSKGNGLSQCPNPQNTAGASGGDGGAGGCGGAGGRGGGAGGASIGIVSLGAKLSFEAATIWVRSGGNGGNGGPGQPGSAGGFGGPGGDGVVAGQSNGCKGGDGGQGGPGGPGGGGSGGPSLGIAYAGTEAPETNGVSITTAKPGSGGNQGMAGSGGAGVAQATLGLPLK